jgi:hypothetical protein
MRGETGAENPVLEISAAEGCTKDLGFERFHENFKPRAGQGQERVPWWLTV